MTIEKIIIHELKKEQGRGNTKIISSDSTLEINDNATSLIDTLNKSYNSENIIYGEFDDSDGKYFPEKYNEYLATSRTKKEFILVTKELIGNLESLISQVSLATGGYFIFSEYSIQKREYFAVFLVRDVEGKTLSRNGKKFQIQNIEYLDTKNMAMACRINEIQYQARDSKYLSLTQQKQNVISEYFKNWISVDQLESSKEYTKTLYDIIGQIETPKDPKTKKHFELVDFRNKVYEYMKSKPNHLVNINELSNHFYNDPNVITEFALENDISIDTEFRYNSTELRKYIKIEIERDGINLKFDRAAIDKKVRISDDQEDLVIIESGSFYRALKKEMENK